jgi:thiamine pyrophosphate-dependent acetolactate synthase large subunit-like protein
MKAAAALADRYVGMDIENPRIDFVAVATGLGLEAHHTTTLADLRDKLAHALHAAHPVLIDVEVDRSWKPV